LIGKSDIVRPYVLSVDGDIPDGATVKIVVNGRVAAGLPWQKEYINPQREPLVTPVWESLAITLNKPQNSFSTPFLYALVIEGDSQKWELDANEIVGNGDISQHGWCFMKTTNERPYIAYTPFMGARVFKSEITRPWIFEIDASVDAGARLMIALSGTHLDGSTWREEYEAPCREPLPNITLNTNFISGMEFKATPDGFHAPQLYGLVFEGDNRRFYIPPAEFAKNYDSENLWVITLPDNESIMTLKPIPPPFRGQPPSILERLMTLHSEGKLRPGVPYFDE
jgi:hypothetical protein